MEEYEPEERHAIIVEDLMKEVQEMRRRNATLTHSGGHPQPSSSFTPFTNPNILPGGMWTVENPPISPSNSRKRKSILKPVVELPYRLEEIERVATDHVRHIERYAKGLVARAKLDTALEQCRKAKKNRKEAEELQDWIFWRNQQKLYEAKEREAANEALTLDTPSNLGRVGLQVLQPGAAAVASFNIQKTKFWRIDASHTNSQLVEHFQEELNRNKDDTLSAKFLKELEETISQTLLAAYTKARQANMEK